MGKRVQAGSGTRLAGEHAGCVSRPDLALISLQSCRNKHVQLKRKLKELFPPP